MTAMDRETGEVRNGASQLDRGLHALELLAHGPQSAAATAAALSVNRSTALRLLQVLENLGYVRRDPRSKRYAIVSERFIGMANGSHVDWHETINPVLERLRDEVGESTLLATPANDVMVYVSYFDCDHTVAVRERLGTVRPMHASALGRAWLSALPAAELDAALGRIDYSGGTRRAASGPLELRQRVRDARQRGWAAERGESVEGVSCVAVPAYIGEVPVGAVAISAPTGRMDDETLMRNGRLLQDAIDRLRR
ncbi:IclR family transcriptional regulator [Conexibacter sp. CPCC 206217]|uniref:IclR family transcriptional regulator n=1 Tax=Conexibacter sp. CPCC 206217 TaxID=3064574 RepID=UPI0027166A45|nr:IclR family transcriptional regulator [Conexibacter sp. CPCC 206217]MDO8212283.1 IclR family transcriptional regulator [Conexibacter sp. CPCC 206217]